MWPSVTATEQEQLRALIPAVPAPGRAQEGFVSRVLGDTTALTPRVCVPGAPSSALRHFAAHSSGTPRAAVPGIPCLLGRVLPSAAGSPQGFHPLLPAAAACWG